MNQPGKTFERIIAAIHKIDAGDATVEWDTKIDGRQFDVSIHFKKGVYEYLTLIECKDYSGPVPVKEVEAFTTKSSDVNANKSIIVASNGFQSGCIQVAEKHGIELLILRTDYNPVDSISAQDMVDALNIFDVRLIKLNGEHYDFPMAPGGRLDFLMKHSQICIENTNHPLEHIINKWQLFYPHHITDEPQEYKLPLPKNTFFRIPIEDEVFEVTHIVFKCRRIVARVAPPDSLDVHVMREMETFYKLTEPCSTERGSFPTGSVKLGFDTVLEVGRYYEDCQHGFKYYCEGIDGDYVKMLMVESYQHGQQFAARFTMTLEHSDNYLLISDRVTITQLEKLRRKIHQS